MQSFLLNEYGAYLCYHDLPGAEPARVFIHGLGSASSAEFVWTAAHPLLRDNRSILLDLPGFGYSDRPRRFGYSLEEHALCAARLLDHLQLKRCDLIGHSMGGSVAITLAALRPDLAGRLVVAEGNLDPGGGSVSTPIAQQPGWLFALAGHRLMLRRLKKGAFEGSAGAVSYHATVRACASRSLHRSAVGLVRGTRPTMRERFLNLDIPRAFIFGQRSLPDPDLAFLEQRGVRVFVVPDAGHAMMDDNPEGFARAVAEALEG